MGTIDLLEPAHVPFLAPSLEATLGPAGRLREVVFARGLDWQEEPGTTGSVSPATLVAPAAFASFSPEGALSTARFPSGLTISRGSGERLEGRQGVYRDRVLAMTGSPRLLSADGPVPAGRTDRLSAARNPEFLDHGFQRRPGHPEPGCGDAYNAAAARNCR